MMKKKLTVSLQYEYISYNHLQWTLDADPHSFLNIRIVSQAQVLMKCLSF